MRKRESGFTLIELLITMAIFVLTIAAATNVFVPLLTQFKQQSRIAETQTEGIIGLDLFRRDIEQAGFGLPWVLPDPGVFSYSEASSVTDGTIPAPNTYNDASNTVPRAIVADNNVAGLGSSDYLVIKATSVAANDAAMKWTYVVEDPAGNTQVRAWGNPVEDLNDGDRVIALIPSRGETNQRILVNDGASFSITFNQAAFPAAFSPSTANDLYLIYGVDPSTSLRMPFNRADYFIRSSGSTIPGRCVAGTGVLVKSVISHVNGNRGVEMPLLDCVADMQVIFGFDMDEDGERGTFSDADGGQVTGTEGATVANVQATLNDPALLRSRLNEVRVYILAHEGQKDATFTYPNATIQMPADPSDPAFAVGSDFDLSASGIPDWQNYRWKVFTLSVKPNNLRS
ncbi:MAG: prepilin-type N-terminal cleavage/methylation domain-containing protein [Nitrospirota bacterium]